MENIENLLKQNDYLMIYSDESSSDNETLNATDLRQYIDDASIVKYSTGLADDNITLKKRKVKERLPTRRPDPNVYNRNALLARENRKKKKIYLETIEKELQLARKANQVLLKALKHQIRIRRQLEEEKLYSKGVTKEESKHLLFKYVSESPSNSETETNKSFSISSSFESLNMFNSADGCEIKSCSSVDSASDDLENEVDCLQRTFIWDDLWSNKDNDNFDKQAPSTAQNILRDVNSDHCYFTNLNDLKTNKVCSHQPHGDFFEIFCPTCSTSPECLAPPMQLLDNTLLK